MTIPRFATVFSGEAGKREGWPAFPIPRNCRTVVSPCQGGHPSRVDIPLDRYWLHIAVNVPWVRSRYEITCTSISISYGSLRRFGMSPLDLFFYNG